MVRRHVLITTLDVLQWIRCIGPCLREDSRSSKRNVFFYGCSYATLLNPSSWSSWAYTTQLIRTLLLCKRGGDSLMSPDLTKNKCCLTRSTCVVSRNGRTNNHLQSTEKYHDNINTSFRGHEFQPSWIATKAVSSSKSNKFVTFPYMASNWDPGALIKLHYWTHYVRQLCSLM